AARARAGSIARDWAGSLTLSAGQFCTNPGVVVLPQESAASFASAAQAALAEVAPQVMLTDGIAGAYRAGAASFTASNKVETLLAGEDEGRKAAPNLFRVAAADWLADEDLSQEVFGPLGVLVTVSDEDEMLAVASALHG